MKISAIICTHNRAAYLPQAIRSLLEQRLPPEDYEILVVDNNSTDNTREIVTGLMREAPNLRYFYETNAGLSCARNRGIREAGAPIVAFLDDDALAEDGWLVAILDAFAIEPRPACVGGPVRPWWEMPKPNWFPASLLGCHDRDYGPHAHWCNYPVEQPIGCNMAFWKQAVVEVGGFDVRLNKYNDETELIRRIVLAGGGIFYQPDAGVRHLVAKERLRLGWQLKRHYYEGISQAVAAQCEASPRRLTRARQLAGNLFWLTRQSARLVLSRVAMTHRIQRATDLSRSLGTAVYLAKSLCHKK